MAGDAVADPLQACRGVRRRRAPLVTPGEACNRACIACGDTFTVSAAERDAVRRPRVGVAPSLRTVPDWWTRREGEPRVTNRGPLRGITLLHGPPAEDRFFLRTTGAAVVGAAVQPAVPREARDSGVPFRQSGRENIVLTIPMTHRRLFAAAAVIWSALDLLAKCHAGDDAIGKAGDRFKIFLEKFVVCSTAEPALFAEVLYLGCRNPLIHSFGLHSKRHTGPLIGNVDGLDVIQRDKADPARFLVSIEGLYWQFVAGVWAYEKALRASLDLQRSFEPMFDRYGMLTVGNL